jgi:O-antigen ligase
MSIPAKLKLPLVFFILILPLYFSMPGGLQLPLFGFLACIFYAAKALLSDAKYFWLIVFYSTLATIQIHLSPIVNYDAFFRKLAAIFVFIGTFSVFSTYYNHRYDKYLFISFGLVVAYAIYSAPSYAIGYDNYLMPGNCGVNNISDIGHLRCSTFGEGNYFGGYIALLLLIYQRSAKFMFLAFVGAIISWSPTPIIVYLYCLYKLIIFKFDKNRSAVVILKNILILGLAVIILGGSYSRMELFFNASERSSLGERFEFIRAGLFMWIDHPLLGVGFGNFGYHLPDYTFFTHLIDRTLYEDSRFIPNNNIVEFLSEQGLIGLLFYIYILFLLSRIRHPIFNRIEIVILILFIGLTMPTFFQIITAALLGILFAKHRPPSLVPSNRKLD